jgi:ABC-type Zn2+ transport system substrate-binding protein/surface adhesin
MNGGGGGNSMVGGNARGGHTAYYANPYPSMANTAPFSHGMPPYPTMTTSDSVSSISSKGSKSSKKRTIDGVDTSTTMTSLPANGGPGPYSFRRTDSNSSTTSTVTAGNNTSLESHMTDDSPQQKRDRSNELPPLNMGNMGFDEHHHGHHHPHNHHPHQQQQHNHEDGNNKSQRARYSHHHRDYSADASTASSLSAGGFSLSSYERGTCEVLLF